MVGLHSGELILRHAHDQVCDASDLVFERFLCEREGSRFSAVVLLEVVEEGLAAGGGEDAVK
jgi:hypothetical protein